MLGQKKKVRTIFILLLTVQLLIFLGYQKESTGIRTHTEYLINKLNSFIFNDEELEEFNHLEKPVFFNNIFDMLEANLPKKTNVEYGNGCKLDTTSIDIQYDEPKFTEEFLSNCLKVSYDVYEALIQSHEKVVNSIPSTFPSTFYKGDGMVMVGGGKYGMLGFLVIKQLRDLGSTIPVEVFIPDRYEDERNFCENILPLVNATCISTTSMFAGTAQKRNFLRFQLKMLAILSSSFENVLFLDSDSFALGPVEDLFDSEPFKSTGLVIWPDFWRRSTSPAYYKIAGKTVGKRVRHGIDSFTNPSFYSTGYEKLSDVPLHDREGTIPDGSSEAGELLINKYKHLSTLLLTLYYNIYGPDFYYEIFTQKCYGKGDKETFIAAAHTLGNPYYQIKRKCEQIGDVSSTDPNKLTGMGLLQFSPVKDYEITQDIKRKLAKNPKLTTNLDGYDKSYVPRQYQLRNQDLKFLHANHGPKFDVIRLMSENKEHRRFGHDMSKVGFDFEGNQFLTLKEYVCDKKLMFTNLREGVNVEQLCAYINKQHEFYESTKNLVKLTPGAML